MRRFRLVGRNLCRGRSGRCSFGMCLVGLGVLVRGKEERKRERGMEGGRLGRWCLGDGALWLLCLPDSVHMAKSSIVMSVQGVSSEHMTLMGPRAEPLASVPFQFCRLC